MGKYEERKLKWQPTCYGCKYGQFYSGCIYCMVGVPVEDLLYVRDINFYGKDFDSRLREIMKILPEEDSFDGSVRHVNCDYVCQFFEKE